MRKRTLALFSGVFLPFVLFSSQGLGYETTYSGNYLIVERQSGFLAEEYEIRVAQKLTRGVKNFFLGWLELPHGVKTEIYNREKEYLPVGIETFFIGVFKGIFNSAGRTAVGIYEMFTFPYAQGPVIQEMEEWLV